MPTEKNLKIASVLTVLALMAIAFNSFLTLDIHSKLKTQERLLSSLKVASFSTGSKNLSSSQQNNDDIETLMTELIPRGVPDIYGEELGVSFEEPVNSLDVLAKLDGDLYKETGKLKFAELSEENKQRYIEIGSKISCEYCCGAESIVFPDGRIACGCAHSAAMRGLAMYILKNHGDKFSDEQVLEELTKWKTLFFPKQTIQKALQLKAQRGEINATTLNELPDMVGGC